MWIIELKQLTLVKPTFRPLSYKQTVNKQYVQLYMLNI